MLSLPLDQHLEILADSAKYDVSCSSSSSRGAKAGALESTAASGICHTWTADGRCISLLIARAGRYADRISINIGLPSRQSLALLTPDKPRESVIVPIRQASGLIFEARAARKESRKAQRIVQMRRGTRLGEVELKKLKVVLKRARYFLTAGGRYLGGIRLDGPRLVERLLAPERRPARLGQLELFAAVPDASAVTGEL